MPITRWDGVVFVVLFVVLCVVLIQTMARGNSCQTAIPANMKRIPFIIWVYWHSGIETAPSLIQQCVQRMRTLHQGWQVNVVCDRTLSVHIRRAFPAGLKRLNIQQRADWYRLALLTEHGGIWLDASVYLLRPITRCFDLFTAADIQGFQWPGLDPNVPSHPIVLEVWALACPKGNWVVRAWLEEWERAIALGVDVYYTLQPKPPDMLRHPYFAVSIAWLAVQKRHVGRIYLRIQNSDLDGGPYYLHHLCQWDADRIARALLTQQDLRLFSSCFVKIRSVDRIALDALGKTKHEQRRTPHEEGTSRTVPRGHGP